MKYKVKRTLTKYAVALSFVSLVAARIFLNSRGYSGAFAAIEYLYPNGPNRLQLDILLPVYNRDDKLRSFSKQLGDAIRDYQREMETADDNKISRFVSFRLLLTRYSHEEQENTKQLQQELSELTSLSESSIILIEAPGGATFERAQAVNLLQEKACSSPTCLVSRIDVDMKILPVFFHHSIEAVYTNRAAYFPIVWSEYYPLSAELAEAHLQKTVMSQKDFKLPQYSEHRGYWREFGTGMWVLSGPHAKTFRLDSSFRGWGGEDGDFYTKVRKALTRHRITRRREVGLIHEWHPKFCKMGVDVFDERQWKDCQGARLGQMGSKLGFELVVQHLEKTMPKEYRHHSIFF